MSTAALWRPEAETQSYMGLVFLTQIIFVSGFAVIFTRKYEGKGIGKGVRYGFSGSCWPSSKSRSFAACRSRCLCRLHRPSLSLCRVCSQVSFYLLSIKKRHPHDLLTRRALCPDRHVRRCGQHIQRRRRQPRLTPARNSAQFSRNTGPIRDWGSGGLDRLEAGHSANTVIEELTQNDPTIGWRKLAVIDSDGQTAFFHGDQIKSVSRRKPKEKTAVPSGISSAMRTCRRP